MQSALFFFFRSHFYPAEVIFSPKSCKESPEKIFPFKVQLSGNNFQIFLPKCHLVLFIIIFQLLWVTVLFSLSQAMARSERSVKRKRRQNSIIQGPFQALLLSPTHRYSKAKKPIQRAYLYDCVAMFLCKTQIYQWVPANLVLGVTLRSPCKQSLF